MSIELTDVEAQNLLARPKYLLDPDKKWRFPELGQIIELGLRDEADSDRFVLTASKSRYKIEKVTYQTRAKHTVVLVRLDLDPDGRHRNPDGNLIVGPHLHLYREGFDVKWAESIDPEQFPDAGDRQDCWHRFLQTCNVLQVPDVEFNLFS